MSRSERGSERANEQDVRTSLKMKSCEEVRVVRVRICPSHARVLVCRLRLKSAVRCDWIIESENKPHNYLVIVQP